MAKRSRTAVAEPEAAPVTRIRRSEEQRIAELEAKIAELKRKAEAKKAKRAPGLRHTSLALRAIDKALAATEDVAMRQALDEARATLAACLQLAGAMPKSGGGVLMPHRRRAGPAVEPDALLAFIAAHPGSRGEQIAAELGTNTTSMRPVMHALIAERRVKTKGQRRGTTYHPV